MNKPNHRVVIGLHSAREAIKIRPKKITEIWLKVGADRTHDLKPFIEFAKKTSVKLKMQPEAEMNKLAPSHQGVCLFVTDTPEFDIDTISDDPNNPMVLVALDEVSDPHNVGAVLRTAWLLGAKALIVPEMRGSGLTPSATKVASGAAEHVPVVITSNLQIELTSLKDKGFWIYGLAGEAATNLSKTKFNERVVLVVGSEDKGLRSTTRNACDELVSIPQTQNEASFNASVAAAIALYEISRQRQKP